MKQDKTWTSPKRLEVLDFISHELPDNATKCRIIDKVLKAESDQELTRVLYKVISDLAHRDHQREKLIDIGYKKSYVHDCGRIHQTYQPLRTTGINEMVPVACNAEYGKL